MLKGLIQGITSKGFSNTRTKHWINASIPVFKKITKLAEILEFHSLICSNHIHGGWSDLVTSPIFNSTACQHSSPLASGVSYKTQVLISVLWWLLVFRQEFGGKEVITKVNLLYITTASNSTGRWLAKVFDFLLVSTQGGPTSQWHTFFFFYTDVSSTALF